MTREGVISKRRNSSRSFRILNGIGAPMPAQAFGARRFIDFTLFSRFGGKNLPFRHTFSSTFGVPKNFYRPRR